MNERRYSEAEVRRIMEAATRPAGLYAASRSEGGLTLAELQSIGEEVGLSSETVGRAAAALDAGALNTPRRSLGMPVEVLRVAPLARAPSDEEWERLVAEIRATFRARGRVTSSGSLRQWSNGNLHICVEPGPQGYQLRMGTHKGDAASLNLLGAAGIVSGAAVFASMVAAGDVQGAIIAPTLLGGSGVAAFLANAIRLPRWAGLRSRQMERIAARASEIIPHRDIA